MKRPLCLIFLLVLATFNLEAQKKNFRKKPQSGAVQTQQENSFKAVVVDERLAVLRRGPSLFARPIQRMRRGREVLISDARVSDGVTFFRVSALPKISRGPSEAVS